MQLLENPIPIENLSIHADAAKLAHDRLRGAWVTGSPYGDELSKAVWTTLAGALTCPVNEQIELLNSLQISNLSLNFDSTPLSLANRLFMNCYESDTSSFVRLVEFVLSKLPKDIRTRHAEKLKQLSEDIETVKNGSRKE